ncbi:S-adenosyl-L-methionine-dependent methyltransferase [Artomyces pyxidatus]|uniref:S-adenosyl-L-methionine-dependent methyltransferase n=1 Tax=Artomyces pyxidatus TaxID=48021 RepID=A0ACB8SGE4_9AGAM|nr:S-adenosyl-L-methionine-dependent methyltransferase [Artomyces pyxidatus]
MTFAVLRALHAIIGSALDEIETVYASNSAIDSGLQALDFPSLDTPYDPESMAEVLVTHPDVAKAISRIVAANGQMSAIVRPPFSTLNDAANGYNLSSALRFLEASNTAELLRASGPSGLHAAEIAKRIGAERMNTAHVLRLLATHHILLEVKPDVFALNRVSTIIDSGKSFDDLRERPNTKYEDGAGAAAFLALCTDELFKASAYLTEALLPDMHQVTVKTKLSPVHVLDSPTTIAAPVMPADYPMKKPSLFLGWLESLLPNTVSRESFGGEKASPTSSIDSTATLSWRATGFNLSQNTPVSFWEWLEAPENGPRLLRFGRGMAGSAGLGATEVSVSPFLNLSPSSLVVDVGGGIGSVTMHIAEQFPELRFVVQDREAVCYQGEKALLAQHPEWLESGRVTFQPHSFFEPQPKYAMPPAVFMLRWITHDWDDARTREILLHLRRAAKVGKGKETGTYLLLADFILPYACEAESLGFEDIEGAKEVEKLEGAQWPLLANMGKASSAPYWMDITMQTALDAQERTLSEFVAVTASAGWKIVQVSRSEQSLFGSVIAVPAPIPHESSL